MNVDRPVLTGSTGFVGSVLGRRIGDHRKVFLSDARWRQSIAATDFRGATVIHLAARVHDMRAPDAAFAADNVEKTRVLGEAAAAGGAVRIVFASTVKVFGEESGERPFGEDDPARPEDAYARSKWQAEEVLREIGARTGTEIVILRIPLTYGPGAAGNFRALVQLADSGAWLPFAAIANRRSLIHVEDLADALILASIHPAAPGRVLLAAHPEAVSTPRLVESIRRAARRPRRLFGLPPALLEAASSVLGLRARMRRLTRSLEVDPAGLMRDLGWTPRFPLDAGIEASLGAGRRFR